MIEMEEDAIQNLVLVIVALMLGAFLLVGLFWGW